MNALLPSRRTSAVLLALVADTGEQITVGDIADRLGDRVYGMLIFVLALPNLLPVPGIPGVSTIFGALMLVVSVQMVIGLKRPWMPARLRRWSFSRDGYLRFIRRITPYLQRIERLLKPRWPLMVTPQAERLLGLIFILLSLAVALPIPFVNWVPTIIISLGALGLIERDGLVVSATALLSVVLLVFVTGLVMTTLQKLLENALPMP